MFLIMQISSEKRVYYYHYVPKIIVICSNDKPGIWMETKIYWTLSC